MFVVTEMWTPPGDDMFMEMLLNIIRNSSAGMVETRTKKCSSSD